MLIEKYPAALQHQDEFVHISLHTECRFLSRSIIISKCIELYPDLLDERVIQIVIMRINPNNICLNNSVLSIIFAPRPMSLYDRDTYIDTDIRDHPRCRRRILHLLPRHVVDPTHDADYRELTWQPRAAMMMLLLWMKMTISSYAVSSRDHRM
jgi:hypothetical protein